MDSEERVGRSREGQLDTGDAAGVQDGAPVWVGSRTLGRVETGGQSRAETKQDPWYGLGSTGEG